MRRWRALTRCWRLFERVKSAPWGVIPPDCHIDLPRLDVIRCTHQTDRTVLMTCAEILCIKRLHLYYASDTYGYYFFLFHKLFKEEKMTETDPGDQQIQGRFTRT